MRKISEMYERSGGTSWEHKCKECRSLLGCKKDKICIRYPEKANWNEDYIACKFYEDREKACELKFKQLNIFNMMEMEGD